MVYYAYLPPDTPRFLQNLAFFNIGPSQLHFVVLGRHRPCDVAARANTVFHHPMMQSHLDLGIYHGSQL